MSCRQCGANTSAPRCFDDGNRMVRLRVCKRCGYTETSVEVYLKDMEAALEAIAKKEKEAVS